MSILLRSSHFRPVFFFLVDNLKGGGAIKWSKMFLYDLKKVKCEATFISIVFPFVLNGA